MSDEPRVRPGSESVTASPKKSMSCAQCGQTIGRTGWETWCTGCGTPLPREVLEWRFPEKTGESDDNGEDTPVAATPAARCQRRYRDAYRVAGAVDGVGGAIKTVSVAVGGLLAFVALVGTADTSLILGFALAVFSVFLALVGFVLGTLVSAQGQVLKAALDGAVNGSPFLSLDEKARAMGVE